jgi:hypothetical protein
MTILWKSSAIETDNDGAADRLRSAVLFAPEAAGGTVEKINEMQCSNAKE